MAERRATMKDVARASGVSPATVSFVLNETPGQTFPAETRERVRAAAAALGYQPHGVARALREGRSRVVLLGIGGLRGGRSLQGFVRGMSAELRTQGYGLLVYPGPSTDPGHADLVRDLRPHAVIDLAEIYAARTAADDGGWTDGLAAHTMTQLAHLVDRGHRSIAFAIPAEPDLDGLAALRAKLAGEAGRRLGVGALPLVSIPEPPQAAREAVGLLRDDSPDVTAVAAFDDEIALRLLGGLSDLGVPVPDEMAVIGFDDSSFGVSWRPPLTTVRIDGEMFGRRAARTILGTDSAHRPGSAARVIVRETT